MSKIFWLGACLALCAGIAGATPQNPDVSSFSVGQDDNNNNDIRYWGQAGGIAAYSFATQSCNAGDALLIWVASTVQHPVIGQNMYRLKEGRFEQLGQSWLKHAFCAVNENESGCGPCQSTPCTTLGLGCADTYRATTNDGRNGGLKSRVNPTDGTHTHPFGVPTGDNLIRGRLQVPVTEMDPALNDGAVYFIEGQYVTFDDAQAGNSANNLAWRRAQVNSVANVVPNGPNNPGQAAIYGWQSEDPEVEINLALNPDEGGPGVHGRYYVGYKATALGGGLWRYDYAIQNDNSLQAAGAFSVPVPVGVGISDLYFHDVDYHSGEIYDNTDWSGVHQNGFVSWTSPETHAENPDSNALRWGTLYTFGFTADAAPASGALAEIQLFAPGPNSVLVTALDGPGAGDPGTSYCTAKSPLLCGTPAIFGAGTPSASTSSGFVVAASPARGQKQGLLLYTDMGAQVPAVPFQGGFLCVEVPFYRSVPVLSNGTLDECDNFMNEFAIDMNAFAAGALGGTPQGFLLVPGQSVDAQFWGRDSLVSGSFLSDAYNYSVGP